MADLILMSHFIYVTKKTRVESAKTHGNIAQVAAIRFVGIN